MKIKNLSGLYRLIDICEHGIPCNTCCYEWLGAKQSRGYSQVRYNGKQTQGHRILYALTHNETLFRSDLICHKCDNKWCMNISHIYKGSAWSNAMDRVADPNWNWKGRKGEKVHLAKVTEDDVRAIRQKAQSGMTHRAIAKEYSIGKSAVGLIVIRQTWRHVK